MKLNNYSRNFMSLKSHLFTWSFIWIHEHQICICHSRERLRKVDKCFLKKSLEQSVQFCHSVTSDSVTPRTAAYQAFISITNSQSLLKLMSIKSVMPSNHLILCRPFLLLPSSFPSTGSFLISQFITSCGQRFGASASESVLPMNIQDWFPLGLTGLISLLSKRLSGVVSNTTVKASTL